ncbi:MAG: hypothetical protein ACKVQW_15740 [Pyrinomonadaceae bacterium]
MLFVIAAGFLLIGMSFLAYPALIRKYDQRLTHFIKNEDGFRFALTIVGAIFLVSAIFALIMGLFLPESAYHE